MNLLDTKKPLWAQSATALVHAIKSKDCKVEEVVQAHINRIEAVNPQINAMVIKLFDQSIQTARGIDQQGINKPLQQEMPLLGLPVSIKECFFLKSTPATAGINTQDQFYHDDGLPVRKLREAGAIPLGKTNLPQLMIIHDSKNPLYGKTSNPWSLAHSVGGSSGGEAAAVASGCSPLGLAGDLGGSIRIPAQFCGVHGLKPTDRRLTKSGTFANLKGLRSIQYQPGPIARHVEDLSLFFEAFKPASPNWSDGEVATESLSDFKQVEIDKLKIGYFIDKNYIEPSPAIQRVIQESLSHLESAGAQIVELTSPDVMEGMRHDFALMSGDGGANFRRLLSGCALEPEISRLVKLAKIPRWLRPALAIALRWQGEDTLAELFLASGPRSTDDYWQADYAAQQFKQEVFSDWEASQIDVVICPPHCVPAFEHDRSVDLMPAAGYIFLFNLLGLPCATLACSRIQPDELTKREKNTDPLIDTIISTERKSEGLPVSIQVASKPWREDQLLAVMAYLEKKFRESETYPDITKLPI